MLNRHFSVYLAAYLLPAAVGFLAVTAYTRLLSPAEYGVYVVGGSMEPRYYPGELVLIHPGKPVTLGAFVLVQRKPKHDGDPPLAVIKRLIKRTASKITLEQFNPAKSFDIRADDIVSVHRVVGASEA